MIYFGSIFGGGEVVGVVKVTGMNTYFRKTATLSKRRKRLVDISLIAASMHESIMSEFYSPYHSL